MDKEIKKKIASNWFKLLQNIICEDIEKIENKKTKFKSKIWSRNKIKDEGGGEFRILKNGKIFEKVGVNFSEVYGKFSKEISKKIPGAKKNPNFWASGISIVMHMQNPYVPAIHFNTRFIYTTHGWFGGGMDVTPSISDSKEKKFIHYELKKMCDRHNKKYYKKYKKWCDEYFYLPHRKEMRGIGGIFFDLNFFLLFSIFSISPQIIFCNNLNQLEESFFLISFSIYLIKLVCLKFSDKIIATEEAMFKDLLLFIIGIFNLYLIELWT